MFTADTLSRAVNKHESLTSEKGADIQVYVDMNVTSLPVSSEKTEQIRKATDMAGTMTQRRETILEGWPEKKSDCPKQILQGKQVCHSSVNAQGDAAHEGHLGEEKKGPVRKCIGQG